MQGTYFMIRIQLRIRTRIRIAEHSSRKNRIHITILFRQYKCDETRCDEMLILQRIKEEVVVVEEKESSCLNTDDD